MPCILGSLVEWIRYEGRGEKLPNPVSNRGDRCNRGCCRKGRCGPVFSGGTRCPNGPHSAGAQVMRLSSKLTSCEAWGGSLSTRWAGFAGKHPAVPVQPVL